MWIAAQCFAIAGGVLMVSSSYSKTKQDMLKIQAADAACCAVASALLGGWAAVILDVLAVLRNDSHSWGYKKQVTTGLWCVVAMVVLFLDKPGLLPVLAEILYTAAVSKCNLAKVKAVLSFSLVLWLCYDFCYGVYPLVVTDCITFVIILIQSKKTVLPGGRLFTLRAGTAGKEGEKREVH